MSYGFWVMSCGMQGYQVIYKLLYNAEGLRQ
jgi:hypothetical protein